MKICLCEETAALYDGIFALSEILDIDIAEDGLAIRFKKAASGHSVLLKDGCCNISYSTVAGAMRAFTLLVNHIKTFGEETALDIREQEVFETCGAMIDVSLGGTAPKIETWKTFLSYMARMGLNMLMVYTEDMYVVKEYPYFGYMRGAYTEEELREIVDYASKFGIEVIPCIQTLGHLGKVQRWKANASLFDNPAVLLIDSEETYHFIECMIQTVRRVFKTNRIHIGMDEAHGVCLGKYYELHGPTNRYETLLRHLRRVVDICKRYDFEPMMWSDMFFRLGSKTNDYYDITAEIPENIHEIIPDGISLVYWDYYHTNANMYQKLLQAHQAMGDVIFAGGVWTWTGFAPKYKQTMDSTYPALEMCRNQGVNHVFATIWNSDYSECDFFNSLLGLQLYAEFHAGGEVTQQRLADAFKACTGMQAESFLAMDIDDLGDENPKYDYDGPYSFAEVEHHIPVISKQVFYQDPLVGLFDKNFSYIDLKKHFTKAYERIAKCNASGIEGELLAIQTAYAKVVMEKCDLGIRLKKMYDAQNKEGLAALIPEMQALIADVDTLHKLYAARYYKNNKPFGFEEKDMRFGGVRARIARAIDRVNAYLNGEIETIDELAAERLSFENRETPFAHLYYVEKMRRP